MSSTYPGAIDGYAQIRVARDGIDEIIAGDHNDLRSAILAIERTLGVNPQGPFGTVVARLNDAYSNIEAHVLGYPPRHQDDVIMSPLRSGSLPSTTPLETLPFSLPEGPLADQVSNILSFLNDSLMYAGSGASTFADGYDLEFSLVRNAITQIVAQLGGATGTEKIGGSVITSTNFDNVSAGTLRSQLVSLLNLIDAFGDSTGAGLVGTSSFYTSTGNRYQFSGSDVQAQIQEAGNFLDEGASFREKAFNGFVASGMAVSGSGGTANIASGFVAANGRMMKYTGGSVAVPDAVTSYIYAEITNNVVVDGYSTSIPTRPENPIVLLHKIVRSGASWTTSVDLRRFGIFTNDKNCISVGNTPSSGRDGYGCDFLSLKSAVEYAKTINSGNELIPPLRIMLASDISITSSSEMEILLDVEGIEIDGCSRKITSSVDAALFKIEADGVTVHDITLESNLGVSGTSQCLAHVGNSSHINNLTITNCKLTKAGGTACTYFLRLGNSGATTVISNSVISENIVEVELGGLEYVSTNKYATVLRDSVILGNNIYQGTFSSTSYAGIKASIHCTIGDNIVQGGFDTGILLALPNQCRVDGNLIIGYQSAVIYMNSGIEIWNSAAGQDNGCVISDNTIKGINNYGINCRAGAGSGAFISVYGNFIDNYYSVGTPPSGMIGIKGRGYETWVVGNKITAPGAHAIENCSHAIGNQIYGHSGITTTTSAIEVASSTIGIVANNTIRGVAGNGIDVSNNTGMVISGNAILGNSNSSTGIDYVGHECVVVGNVIMDYTSNGIQSVSGEEVTFANNRIIDCQGRGISCYGTGNVVVGNWMECPVGTGGSAINGVGSFSIIANNFIANYGSGGYYAIELDWTTGIDVAITGNLIKNIHVNTQGVLYTPGGWSRISVVGNVLDNCPYAGFRFAGASQVLCADNIISGDSTSTSAIYNFGSGSVIIGNMIETYCTNATDTAIYSYSGADNIVIANNHIIDCNGVGIDANGGENLIVSNNFLKGGSNSRDGIREVNQYSIISGNIILGYGADTGSYYGIVTNGSSGKINVIGNVIYLPGANLDYGISLTTDIFYVIVGNLIGDQWNSVGKTPIAMNGSNHSIIANNYMGTAATGVAGDHGIKGVGDSCLVCGNIVTQANDDGIELAEPNILCANNVVNSPYGNGIVVGSSATTCLVSGNKIHTAGQAGVEILGNYASCVNNFVQSPTDYGILCAGTLSLISSNYIYGSSDQGIFIDEDGSYSTVCSNQIFDCSYGINVSLADGLLIVGNRMYTVKGGGILLNESDGTSIVSNYVRESTSDSGIYVTSSDQVLISSNFIYNSGDIGIESDSSVDSSIIGNYIMGASSYGIQVGATGGIIDCNWIRDPSDSGIMLLSSATYAAVRNNYIWSPGGCGIEAESGADELLISSNMIRETTSNGIGLLESTFASIIGNYVYNPGTSGIVLTGASSGSNITGNWVFSPASSGLYIGGTSSGCVISGNWIRDAVSSGIYFSSSANECVISGNFLTRCGGNGSAQIDLMSCDDWACVGNNILSPTNVNSIGIDMRWSDSALCVGNRCVGGSSVSGISYSSATDYVIEGNMSRGGANPGGFYGLPLLGDDNGYKA